MSIGQLIEVATGHPCARMIISHSYVSGPYEVLVEDLEDDPAGILSSLKDNLSRFIMTPERLAWHLAHTFGPEGSPNLPEPPKPPTEPSHLPDPSQGC